MSSVKDKQKSKDRTINDSNPNENGVKKSSLDAGHILNSLKNKAKKQQKLPTSQIGVPKGWRKMTFIIRDENHEKLKNLSYWEKVHIKDILDAILEQFFASVKTKS